MVSQHVDRKRSGAVADNLKESAAEPTGNVVKHRGNETDVGVGGDAARFEAGVQELVHENFELNSILQTDGNGKSQAIHHAGKSGAFLGHFDEDFARTIVFIKADGDVAFVATDAEFVG